MNRLKLTLVSTTLLLLGSTPSPAAEKMTIHVPPGWQGAYEFGYAPVLRVGDWVIVSGIPAGGDGTYEEKIRRMYERAGELLGSAGATFDDVVELTTFHTTPENSPEFQAEFDKYMPIHREFLGEHRPAWTAVGTTALLSQTAPVEMRLVAVVGAGKTREVVGAEASSD